MLPPTATASARGVGPSDQAEEYLVQVGTSAGQVMQSSGRALHMSYDVLSGYHSVGAWLLCTE